MRPTPTVIAALVALVIAACSVPPTSPPGTTACSTPVGATDVGSTSGWIDYLRAHPGDYGVDITPVHGERIVHNADEAFPTASSIKLVHLAAAAEALAAGRIRADDTVSVADWERWYFPLDGGAHVESLKYLGIDARDGIATDPTQRVSYRQLIDVMIRFSDSAAPDLLRERLGDNALRDLMNRYGLGGTVPGMLGLYLALVDPSLTTPELRDRAARRYHDDPGYATQMLLRIRTIDPRTVSSDSTIRATPSSLHALMAAIADGSLGAGAATARQFLEFRSRRPDGSVLGAKGGSLPGILTEVFEYRTDDGRRAVGTLMIRGLSVADMQRDRFAHQQLLLGALTDPGVAGQLRCIV